MRATSRRPLRRRRRESPRRADEPGQARRQAWYPAGLVRASSRLRASTAARRALRRRLRRLTPCPRVCAGCGVDRETSDAETGARPKNYLYYYEGEKNTKNLVRSGRATRRARSAAGGSVPETQVRVFFLVARNERCGSACPALARSALAVRVAPSRGSSGSLRASGETLFSGSSTLPRNCRTF